MGVVSLLRRGEEIQDEEDKEHRHRHAEQDADQGLADEVEGEAFEHEEGEVVHRDHAEGVAQKPREA